MLWTLASYFGTLSVMLESQRPSHFTDSDFEALRVRLCRPLSDSDLGLACNLGNSLMMLYKH